MDEEITLEFKKVWEAIGELKDSKATNSNIQEEINSDEEKISRFCSELEIRKEDFNLIFKISEKDVSLKVPIEGKNEAEKQLKTTLVLITVKDSLFEEDFMKSADITIVLKRLGIKSIVNLSTNLNKHSSFLQSKGKPKSKNFGFRITIPGIVEGKKLIKELLKNG